ncbi:MAG: zinc ribbon domain-containing protein [Methanothrix sp.]|nr:zinc ribbon domain-containing protein [Methanothrix sp.]
MTRNAIYTRAQEIPAKIALVDPADTSQTCHVWCERGIRNGKSFKCPSCSWSVDADFNGAKNIAFLGRYVVRPGGSEGLPSIKAVLSRLQKAHLLSGMGRLQHQIQFGSSLSLEANFKLSGYKIRSADQELASRIAIPVITDVVIRLLVDLHPCHFHME